MLDVYVIDITLWLNMPRRELQKRLDQRILFQVESDFVDDDDLDIPGEPFKLIVAIIFLI